MTAVATHYVVDASVGIKLFVNEPHSDKAHALFSLAAGDPRTEFHVPELFYIESVNILWKCVRRARITETSALESVVRLQGLPLSRVATDGILREALRLALEHRISAYDATYVASALLVGAPLVTCDEPLAGKFKGKQPSVVLLADLPLPQPQS
ncbi:MAG TPA: type II toxin-antitoxin system VapC family toxin [Planctomycetota bacterium]|nr:type II toxin-antitoxin system VapC family toxin [Planctomycetota bacterium]